MKKKKKGYLITRLAIKYVKVIFIVLGCFYVAESISERNIPIIESYTLLYDPKIVSHKKLSTSTSAEDCWNALEIPLEILNDINPQARDWVIDRYKNKKIKFKSRDEKDEKSPIASYLCKYDWINGDLIISNGIWVEDDGTIAVLLCHEYRHSIQSWFKRFRYVISFVFYKNGNEAIIENDAYLYEREAFCSIFKINYPF